MKSIYVMIVFGFFAIFGSFMEGNYYETFTTQQSIGLTFVVFGLMGTGISYGWFLRSEQPDLKAERVNDIISNNRNT